MPEAPPANACKDAARRDAFNASMLTATSAFESALTNYSSNFGDTQAKIDALSEAGQWTESDDDSFAPLLMIDKPFAKISRENAQDFNTILQGTPQETRDDGSVLSPEQRCRENLKYHTAFRRSLGRAGAQAARANEVLADYLKDRGGG